VTLPPASSAPLAAIATNFLLNDSRRLLPAKARIFGVMGAVYKIGIPRRIIIVQVDGS